MIPTIFSNCNVDVPATLNKPTLFVIDGTGTNTFNSIIMTNCKGMRDGGIFKINKGTVTNTQSSYDGVIVYQGGIYSLAEDTAVIATNVNLLNSFVYRGGVAYSTTRASISMTTTTISTNKVYDASLFYFSAKGSTVSLSAATITSNSADRSTIVECTAG